MLQSQRTASRTPAVARGFTLIEVLVVIAIISLLVSILLPSLRKARLMTKAVICSSNLRAIGQGWQVYAGDNHGVMVPGRLPVFREGGFRNKSNTYRISTGKKYRPRWPAIMQGAIGTPAIRHPKTGRSRQEYASKLYTCPMVAEWTDERNSAYGYNYQFLGSHRLDEGRLRNLPVPLARIRAASKTVVVADSLGSAAAFATRQRMDYSNSTRDLQRKGNYAWLLDPPRLDANSSRAGGTGAPRSAPDMRHLGKANVLFADGHVRPRTLAAMGYEVDDDGTVLEDGPEASNRFFSGSGQNVLPP